METLDFSIRSKELKLLKGIFIFRNSNNWKLFLFWRRTPPTPAHSTVLMFCFLVLKGCRMALLAWPAISFWHILLITFQTSFLTSNPLKCLEMGAPKQRRVMKIRKPAHRNAPTIKTCKNSVWQESNLWNKKLTTLTKLSAVLPEDQSRAPQKKIKNKTTKAWSESRIYIKQGLVFRSVEVPTRNPENRTAQSFENT